MEKELSIDLLLEESVLESILGEDGEKAPAETNVIGLIPSEFSAHQEQPG